MKTTKLQAAYNSSQPSSMAIFKRRERADAKRQEKHEADRERFRQDALKRVWFNMYYGGKW